MPAAAAAPSFSQSVMTLASLGLAAAAAAAKETKKSEKSARNRFKHLAAPMQAMPATSLAAAAGASAGVGW